jgi:hypothetical protein
LPNTKVSHDRIIVAAGRHRVGQISVPSSERDWYEIKNLSLEDFLRTKGFLSSSGLVPYELKNQFGDLSVFNTQQQVQEIKDSLSVQLWTSSKDSCAHLHYDRSNNFVVQVIGSKQWYDFSSHESISQDHLSTY